MTDENFKIIAHPHQHGVIQPTNKTTDVVCGMTVDPATTPHKANHQGREYFFCSAGCKTKFQATPEKYIDSVDKAPEAVIAGAIYTCPMHPEIRQAGPGSCPICGMALEPLTVTADSGPNHELRDMTMRFWIGLGLALPVLVMEMGGHLTGLTMLLGQQLSNWIQLHSPRLLCSGRGGRSLCGDGNR